MRAAIALLFFLSILLIAYANDTMTGSVVANDNPCRIVHCNVRLFGFLTTDPEWIATTPDGLAVCHCPQESMDYLFYVSITRRGY